MKKSSMSQDLITHILKELKDNIDANHKQFKLDLTEIKLQTQKTNGRVSSLERWRSYIAGAIAILSIVGVPIILKQLLALWK